MARVLYLGLALLALATAVSVHQGRLDLDVTAHGCWQYATSTWLDWKPSQPNASCARDQGVPQAADPLYVHAADSSCSCKTANAESELGVGVCQLSGTVTDCCCDYGSVEKVNRDSLNPVLSQLVKLPFFRYFKVNLFCECPFWPDDGMCMLRDCSVCECEEAEIPKLWREQDKRACDDSAMAEAESVVNRTLDPHTREQLIAIPGWRGLNNPWMPEDDKDLDFSYINLLQNPERYTGYKGEHAHRIWELIYSQSCFQDINAPDTCAEKRIFYRLISGVHASISAHIANDFLLDEAAGLWGPSLEQFEARLGNLEVRDRVENLYFAYLFVLRAVMKAGPLLERADYNTGEPVLDAETVALMQQLAASPALKQACPVPFDEGRLWKSEDSAELKKQLQGHFHNITQVMDCVGCEKCKLWGKLQMLGIATSLKVLFSSDDCTGLPTNEPRLTLERNEVIALINLLERLSQSIEVVRKMSLQLDDNLSKHPEGLGAITEVTHQGLQQYL
ncbi:hypothetical protein WJX72_011392 [[Myrmecia] bisecta]|uniref:Endoplasmic reticulum oxidoreductin-1 n=1 Tax=[Myrmecia] bisecta TaxID=41462 RepID=A0AAW1PNR3_9CHLO